MAGRGRIRGRVGTEDQHGEGGSGGKKIRGGEGKR